MQLDQARIAICERSWLDNLDLALQVVRNYAGGLAACAAAGILPFALFNYALIGGSASDVFPEEEWSIEYYWLAILVMIEAPLATAPLTLYLGQVMFDQPGPAKIARDFFRCLPQLLLLQVVLRTVLIIPVVTWFVPYVLWPYLNEVILLERNPLIGGRGQVSTLARNGSLHRGNGGESLWRAAGTIWLAPMLIVALYVTQEAVLTGLFGFEPGPRADAIAFQAVLWLVAVDFAVARFLSYLDHRIRNEGWEVELLLRAQSDRLTRPIA